MLKRAVPVILAAGLAWSQSAELLKPWGGPSGFPALYRESIDAFFSAEAAYRAGEFERSSKILNDIWARHPPGMREWLAATREVAAQRARIADNHDDGCCRRRVG